MEKAAIMQKPFYPSDTPIYLTGANPFVLPNWKLKQYIEVLRKHYPDFSRISLQSRIDDIARKSDEELAELARLGLSHLYIETENGDDEALTLMNKGYTASDAAVRCQLHQVVDVGDHYFYVCNALDTLLADAPEDTLFAWKGYVKIATVGQRVE